MNHRTFPSAKLRESAAIGLAGRLEIGSHIGRLFVYDSLSWVIQALLSLLGLILFSPLLALISLLIKVTSRGPLFYKGERVGHGEQIFRIYKFRTLIEGAEDKIGARLLNDEDRNLYYTKMGRFLKRSKLDELPQLLNVIRGEMRLTGPRPIRPIFLNTLKQEIPNYAFRFFVPPGITGIAQLRGGYYTSPRNKLRYDLIYIKRRSLLLDLKLVLLTFVKILNRWLNAGFFVLFLFLFVSFIPSGLQPFFPVPLIGIKVKLVYLIIILAAAWIFLKKGPSQFYLYRCPLNLPMLSFMLLSLLLLFFTEEPYRILQRSGYYFVTGFLVSVMVVNTLGTRGFITLTVRLIALTSTFLSLVGLFEVAIFNNPTQVVASSLSTGEELLQGYRRADSILQNPIVLAVYLVLGIPLLLSQVTLSHSQRERDFWLVCTTISFVGIFFTQSRFGLLALLVTGTLYLCRRVSHAFSFFMIFLVCFLFLVSLGAHRFSTPEMRGDVTRWVQEKTRILQTVPVEKWLIGAGEIKKVEVAVELDPQKGFDSNQKEEVAINNMHLTLVLEHGIAGWLIIMWLILSSFWAMKKAHDRTKDERLKTTLWAIMSSILGFLVSMNGMNTFHKLSIQIFFWSLLGIGLWITIQLNGHERYNLIWRFGDSGD